MKGSVAVRKGFPGSQRDAAARLYMDAFGAKLAKLMGHDGRAERFFLRVLDPSHAISALSPDGKLLGFAGFKTEAGAFAGGSLHDLAAVYGWTSVVWRAPLLALLERKPTPGQLLMDGIAVNARARGQGIGTLLLSAIVDLARDRGMREVRLDVIDTNPRANPRARALDERFGFRVEKTENIGPLRLLFSFSSATQMVYALKDATN